MVWVSGSYHGRGMHLRLDLLRLKTWRFGNLVGLVGWLEGNEIPRPGAWIPTLSTVNPGLGWIPTADGTTCTQ